MQQSVIKLVTAGMVLWHAVVGCCAHHAHGTSAHGTSAHGATAHGATVQGTAVQGTAVQGSAVELQASTSPAACGQGCCHQPSSLQQPSSQSRSSQSRSSQQSSPQLPSRMSPQPEGSFPAPCCPTEAPCPEGHCVFAAPDVSGSSPLDDLYNGHFVFVSLITWSSQAAGVPDGSMSGLVAPPPPGGLRLHLVLGVLTS